MSFVGGGLAFAVQWSAWAAPLLLALATNHPRVPGQSICQLGTHPRHPGRVLMPRFSFPAPARAAIYDLSSVLDENPPSVLLGKGMLRPHPASITSLL